MHWVLCSGLLPRIQSQVAGRILYMEGSATPDIYSTYPVPNILSRASTGATRRREGCSLRSKLVLGYGRILDALAIKSGDQMRW